MEFTPWVLLIDAGLIGVLLAIGTWLRAVIPWLQTMMIPASVMAGILGLAFGPNGLGWIPFSEHMGTYGSVLIAVVFACIALTDDFNIFKIGRNVASFSAYGVLMYSLQVALGMALVLMLIGPLFNAPDSIGVLLFAGWAGGFGSAAAIGDVFTQQAGDPEMASLAYTAATVGLIVGVVGGIIQAKIGASRGHAKAFRGMKSLPEDMRTGLIRKVEERPAIGQHTFSGASVESLAFQVGVVSAIAAGAYGVTLLVTSQWENLTIPVFSVAFVLGLIVRSVMTRTKVSTYLDRGSLNSVAGSATDILIVCGIASIAPAIVAGYWVELLILFAFGLALCLVLGLVVAPRLMQDGWFEKQLFTWGWATGAVSTGVALLRITDPKLESGTMEEFGVAYIPVTPVEIAAVTFVPLLVIAGSAWLVVGIWGAIAVVAMVAAFFIIRANKRDAAAVSA